MDSDGERKSTGVLKKSKCKGQICNDRKCKTRKPYTYGSEYREREKIVEGSGKGSGCKKKRKEKRKRINYIWCQTSLVK